MGRDRRNLSACFQTSALGRDESARFLRRASMGAEGKQPRCEMSTSGHANCTLMFLILHQARKLFSEGLHPT